jgi:basic membrane protein A
MRRTRITTLATVVAATSLAVGGAVSAQDASMAPAGSSDLKIGLVTDVGTLDDRNFNQYSWEGTLDGAARIGAPEPKSAISVASTDIGKNIQAFVDEDYDIIVTIGFAAGADTAIAAKANPDINFIGVDQSFICLDANGDPDKEPADDPATPDVVEGPDCDGDPAALLPNRLGIGWHEEQPGYLAGIVAASISQTGHIAAVGGTASVPAVPNYIIGYENGAKSVNPDITVTTYYVSPAPDTKAFGDSAQGKSDANQLLAFFPDIDVFFQVAGKTGNGVLEAACEAGIYGIGVDVDQFISTPEFQDCIVVSAEKKLKKNVSDAIAAIAAGTNKSGGVKLDITTDDVGLSPFHDFESQVTPELQAALDAAVAGLKDGSVQACELSPFQSCVMPTP